MFRRNISRIAHVVTAIASRPWPWPAPAYAAEPQILAAYTCRVIIGNITAWIVGLLVGVATLFLTIGGPALPGRRRRPDRDREGQVGVQERRCIGYALAVLAPILLGVVQGWIGG